MNVISEQNLGLWNGYGNVRIRQNMSNLDCSCDNDCGCDNQSCCDNQCPYDGENGPFSTCTGVVTH